MKNHFAESVELRQQAKTKIPIKIPTKGKRNQNNNTNTNASKITDSTDTSNIYICIIHQKNC